MDNDKKIIFQFIFSTAISLIALIVAIIVLLSKCDKKEENIKPIAFEQTDTTFFIKNQKYKIIMLYSKEEFLKAAELGEVSMIDANHIVSLLFEARIALGKTTDKKVQCSSCEKTVDFSTVIITCYECSK